MFEFLKKKGNPPKKSVGHQNSPASADSDKPAAALPANTGAEAIKSSPIASGLRRMFSGKPKLDEALLDNLESCLISADVGVTTSQALIAPLRQQLKQRAFADYSALHQGLRTQLLQTLEPVSKPLQIDPQHKPFVILTVGVNGAGKTTTIGKLARRFQKQGLRLMLSAGDTFRAAAIEQLKSWGARHDISVIAQGQNADPASVSFDALQAAKAKGLDILIADTAGRLHTQQGLMAELGKIARVMSKLDSNAPHEVLLVIDGTTGQNAISQVRSFNQALKITGLVVTKLDGTAKGGIIIALAKEFGIPIRFIGVGERTEDLQEFNAHAFVDAILPTISVNS